MSPCVQRRVQKNFRWIENGAGERQLTPTAEIITFNILSLPAGAGTQVFSNCLTNKTIKYCAGREKMWTLLMSF